MGYDYEQTHEKIMKSAMEHFTEKGFLAASIRQICKDAGVTNGAFYAHFKSKEDLFDALVGPAVRGTQELYDTESAHYMDIHSAGDVRKLMKEMFSSNRRLIRYLYEHKEAFCLILCAGAGTEYEDFIDRFAKEEALATMEFLKLCSPYLPGAKKISGNLLKQISYCMVASVFEGLRDGKTEEELLWECEQVSEFCMAGMFHFLGI